MVDLDYVVVGHATRDLKGRSFAIGGTAVYAARTARALGCRTGVLTSVEPHLDLSEELKDVLVIRSPAQETTTFKNIYADGQRRQLLYATAEALLPSMVPDDWRARIVHVGPVARECDPALTEAFAKAFVGVTPQGWMRQWDDEGWVTRRPWREAGEVLPFADAVVLSEEDLAGDQGLAARYAARTALLVLTHGAAGCTVYADQGIRHFPPPAVTEVDATGAGDIFAACLFFALQREHDPWVAARFANCLAARSVTRPGLSGTPSAEEVARCKQAILGEDVGHAHRLRAG